MLKSNPGGRKLMLSDSNRFFKTVVGVCLIASPLILLASALVAPEIKSGEADQLAVIAQDPGRYYLFTVLIFVSTALWVPLVLGLMYMVREEAAALGNIGGSLALIATLVAVGDAVSQLFIWQMVSPGADRAQMVALLTRFDNAAGAAIFFRIGGPALVIGMVILSIALYRARAVPAWTAAGTAFGTLLNIAAFVASSNLLVIVSAVVLVVSLGWIGRLLLARDAQEWERAGVSQKPGSARAVTEHQA
jgi:hypothetical protein